MYKTVIALILSAFVSNAFAADIITAPSENHHYTRIESDALIMDSVEVTPTIVDFADPTPGANGGIVPIPPGQGKAPTPPNQNPVPGNGQSPVPGAGQIPGQGQNPSPFPGPVVSDPTNPVNQVIMIIDGLLALGKKIWPIIDAGRPVIDQKLAPAVSVVPHLKDTLSGVLNEMENWSMPKTQSYRVSVKNKFGSEVVAFTYTVLFQFNGDLNGNGKYVTSLKVLTSNIVASWGFDLAASSELVSISNVGTMANPIASAIISINYAIKGKLNEVRNAHSFYVDGNGKLEVLAQ